MSESRQPLYRVSECEAFNLYNDITFKHNNNMLLHWEQIYTLFANLAWLYMLFDMHFNRRILENEMCTNILVVWTMTKWWYVHRMLVSCKIDNWSYN